MDFCPPAPYWQDMANKRTALFPALMHPSFEAFNKYIESYAAAYGLSLRKRELQKQLSRLRLKVATLETALEEIDASKDYVQIVAAPKRRRRIAEDIQRCFQCPYERCRKVYGTLGSLQQHLRLKHCPSNSTPSTVLLENDSC